MNKPIGFSYICPNCNYYSFVYATVTVEKGHHWTCWRCGSPIPSTATIPNINLIELEEDGFDMKIKGKECHWVKVENPPDEIEFIGDCTIQTFNCPYCQAQHQQFIELSKNPYKVGVLCPSCSTLYYGEWKEKQETEEIIVNGTNT